MDRHGDRDNIYDIYQGMNTMNRRSDTGQEKSLVMLNMIQVLVLN